MRYVEKSLTDGEQIVYECHRHWIVMLSALVFAAIFIAGGVLALIYIPEDNGARVPAAVALFAMALIFFLVGWMRRYGFEFAVTNKRVIYRKGIVSVATDELFLNKIESVLVHQGLMDRLLGAGTVTLRGTGGSWEPFRLVSNPLLLRKKIQEQVEKQGAA